MGSPPSTNPSATTQVHPLAKPHANSHSSPWPTRQMFAIPFLSTAADLSTTVIPSLTCHGGAAGLSRPLPGCHYTPGEPWFYPASHLLPSSHRGPGPGRAWAMDQAMATEQAPMEINWIDGHVVPRNQARQSSKTKTSRVSSPNMTMPPSFTST
ncbi:hypothetical protein CDD82_500 [Ophiocordyceps australis]|uniref:Uncharacterized protein n=1 Tax=Ophiocordyceps australis TaxID=1399860 RepID=A0A2C5YMJ3_9HYPO|nr:hypothetical protein CDD82_500 [Ophiocordyceps australis]